MTERLDLDALEAVARAATPGPWTYKPTILGLPNTTVMAGDDQLGYMGVGHFLAPNATHVATFDPPTVLALIAKLREAEAVIEKELSRHREKHGETPRFAPDDYQHELEPTHWEPYVICDACGTFWPCKTTQTLVYKPTNNESEGKA